MGTVWIGFVKLSVCHMQCSWEQSATAHFPANSHLSGQFFPVSNQINTSGYVYMYVLYVCTYVGR